MSEHCEQLKELAHLKAIVADASFYLVVEDIDFEAIAEHVERLERIRLGALRQSSERIKYGYGPGIGHGYFVYTVNRDQHYAGPELEDALAMLGGFDA